MIKINKSNLIVLLLSITFLVTSFNTIEFFLQKSLAQYTDWLINYQAGFVRRGFVGEVFYQISDLLNLRLDILILVFIIFLYFFFYLNFYKIIKNIKIKIIDLFIILSPLSFFYTAFEQKASGRKEIVFFYLLSFFILFVKKISPIKQITVITIFTAFTTLTHSGLIFYNIYFLLLFVCLNYQLGFKKNIILLSPVFFSNLVILFLISFNSTFDQSDLNLMCKSIKEYLPNCGNGDYINTLTWSLQNNFEGNKKLWFSINYFIFYFFNFIFCFSFFLYSSNKSKIKNFNYLYAIIICLIPSLPLYFIGADYGRYLHISYISSILIYYFLLKENIVYRENILINFRKIIIIPLLFFYSFTWTVPHCCNDGKPKFNFRNIKNIISN